MSNKKEGWPGCDYRCSQCGNVKFIITNTFMPEIWEACTDNCSWSNLGDLGPVMNDKEGKPTGFHKRRYLITGEHHD
jgi:hypothetical protein